MEGKREGEGEGERGRKEKGNRTRECKPRKSLRG